MKNKDRQNEALAKLNSTLRELLVDTKIISIEQWNSIIASKLSKLSMTIDETAITARTYRLPENYFEEHIGEEK